MKKIFATVFFIIFSFTCFAQPFSGVVEVENVTATQLYTKALEWYALRFVSANEVIQLSDETNKNLIGKGVSKVKLLGSVNVSSAFLHFTLQTIFKDGRFKYEFSNLYVVDDVLNGKTNPVDLYKTLSNYDSAYVYFTETLKIKPWLIIKKDVQRTAENNALNYALFLSELDSTIVDLKTHLIKIDTTSW